MVKWPKKRVFGIFDPNNRMGVKKKPLYMKIFRPILLKTGEYSLFYVQNKFEIVNMMFIENILKT